MPTVNTICGMVGMEVFMAIRKGPPQTFITDGMVTRIIIATKQVPSGEVCTLIDTADVSKLDKVRCYYNGKLNRVMVKGPTRQHKMVYLHRFLLNAPDEMEVDHINGDRLDNRGSNLRLIPPHLQNENVAGKEQVSFSGHRGVSWDPRRESWYARVTHNGRQYLKYAVSKEIAIQEARALRAKHFVIHNESRHGGG